MSESAERPTGEKKPVEQWATEKGHLVYLPNGEIDPRAPNYWRFAAARSHAGWPVGREVTEQVYDATLDEVGKVEIR